MGIFLFFLKVGKFAFSSYYNVTMQGSKYGSEIREKAYALLSVNDNVSQVARELNLSFSTVNQWKKKFISEGLLVDKEESLKELAKLREEQKKNFVERAWGILGNIQTLMERRVARAVNHENELDKMIEVIQGEDLPDVTKAKIIGKLRDAKMEDARSLAVLFGTLYDKQALASNDATNIVDGGVKVLFNIPRPEEEKKE